MLKFLQWLWDKCGEEDFTLKAFLVAITTCSLYVITSLDIPPALSATIIFLNAVAFMVYLCKDDNDE